MSEGLAQRGASAPAGEKVRKYLPIHDIENYGNYKCECFRQPSDLGGSEVNP